jgi:hypothetical protein
VTVIFGSTLTSWLASGSGVCRFLMLLFERCMNTEQPTGLEDVDEFFHRGELDKGDEVRAGGSLSPLADDDDVEGPPPLSAEQLARRARLRTLVAAIVAPLGVACAFLLGPRALSSQMRTVSRAESAQGNAFDFIETPRPAKIARSAGESVEAARAVTPAPIATETAALEPRIEPVGAVIPSPVASEAPAPGTDRPSVRPKSVDARSPSAPVRVALREARRASAPSSPGNVSQPSSGGGALSATPIQHTDKSEPLPTARFATTASN